MHQTNLHVANIKLKLEKHEIRGQTIRRYDINNTILQNIELHQKSMEDCWGDVKQCFVNWE